MIMARVSFLLALGICFLYCCLTEGWRGSSLLFVLSQPFCSPMWVCGICTCASVGTHAGTEPKVLLYHSTLFSWDRVPHLAWCLIDSQQAPAILLSLPIIVLGLQVWGDMAGFLCECWGFGFGPHTGTTGIFIHWASSPCCFWCLFRSQEHKLVLNL